MEDHRSAIARIADALERIADSLETISFSVEDIEDNVESVIYTDHDNTSYLRNINAVTKIKQ